MIPNRMKRVSELFARTIIEIIREEIDDPRLQFCSVLEVKVSPDLRTARVFVSIMGEDEDRMKGLERLNTATGFIHELVKRRVSMKRIPSFSFVLDDSIARAVSICSLIDKVRTEDKKIVEEES